MANEKQKNDLSNLAIMLREASRDSNLMRELFKNPDVVAKRYDVILTKHHMEKLKSAGNFLDTFSDLEFGRIQPDPVFYPIDKMLVIEIGKRIKETEGFMKHLDDKFKEIYKNMFHWYPAPPWYPMRVNRNREKFFR